MQLFNGDCLELMKYIPDKSIDMVLTDLPYGTMSCKWDNVIPFDKMWEHLNRIIKDNGAIVLFGSEPFSSMLRMSNIKHYKYDWIWKKQKAGSFAVGKYRPLCYHENISVFGYGKINYYPQMIPRKSDRVKQAHKSNYKGFSTGANDNLIFVKAQENRDFKIYNADFKLPSTVLEFNSVVSNSKEKVAHPTQKPVALLECLIKTYTLENETVLDFTMGSGSTGVACVNTNRNFIGIELDTKYFEIAKERINEAAMLNSISYKSTVGRSD